MRNKILYGLLLLIAHYSSAQTIRKVEYYGNDSTSRLKKVYHVLQDRPTVYDGNYLFFYQEGGHKIEGQFKKNKPVGKWTYFYESGRPKRIETYQNDSISYIIDFYEGGEKSGEGLSLYQNNDSIWNFYYENGNTKSRGRYTKGLKDSTWVFLFEEGQKKAIGEYENGSGNYIEYYLTGEKKIEGSVVNGEAEGIWKTYHLNGRLASSGYESNGKKNGVWENYYESGNLKSRGNFLNGVKMGKWVNYFDKEKRVVQSEGEMTKGVRNGHWKTYDRNGQFKGEFFLVNGTGTFKQYYDNHNLEIEGFVKDDLADSTWKYYYKDGVIKATGKYKKGIGHYVELYRTKERKLEGDYKYGNPVGAWVDYYRDGTVKGTRIYIDLEDPVYKAVRTLPQVDNPPPPPPPDKKASKPIVTTKIKKRPFYNHPHVYDETSGIIISINPLAVVLNQIPISVEYFVQEWAGYDLRFALRRVPIFGSTISNGDTSSFGTGFSIDFKYRYYDINRATKGIRYIAPEIRFRQNSEFADVIIDGSSRRFELDSKFYEVALNIGTRIVNDLDIGGFTFDFNVGLGVAYVQQTNNYNNDFSLDPNTVIQQDLSVFLIGDNFALTPRLGFSVGYLF